jgi:hemerythrin-like domain-containing protein
MPKLATLRQEHAELVEIVRELGRVIARLAQPAQTELFELRCRLTTTLIAHLKAEDWLLYPPLLASSDALIAGIAKAFSEEMGGLASAYSAHAERWGADAIEHDWAGYVEATRGIIDALTRRISRENRELYPLLERLDQAA